MVHVIVQDEDLRVARPHQNLSALRGGPALAAAEQGWRITAGPRASTRSLAGQEGRPRVTRHVCKCANRYVADSAAHRTGQALPAGSASAYAPALPRTFFRPWKRWAWRAAIATVPNTQKPMGPAATAWCPARAPQVVSDNAWSPRYGSRWRLPRAPVPVWFGGAGLSTAET